MAIETSFFENFSCIFSFCYTPRELVKSPTPTYFNWYFHGNFAPFVLLMENFAKNKQN